MHDGDLWLCALPATIEAAKDGKHPDQVKALLAHYNRLTSDGKEVPAILTEFVEPRLKNADAAKRKRDRERALGIQRSRGRPFLERSADWKTGVAQEVRALMDRGKTLTQAAGIIGNQRHKSPKHIEMIYRQWGELVKPESVKRWAREAARSLRQNWQNEQEQKIRTLRKNRTSPTR
jgi:hypothetical protein